jgi:hypothetical protein
MTRSCLRALDGDGDGFFALEHDGSDCDDEDPAVNPDAAEVCDLQDNDCDGQQDEGFTVLWYLDADGDGYGDPASPFEGCTPPARYVNRGEDCDDADPNMNPGTLWYYDYDRDGYGIETPKQYACEPPEGYARLLGDCDDYDEATSTLAPMSLVTRRSTTTATVRSATATATATGCPPAKTATTPGTTSGRGPRSSATL